MKKFILFMGVISLITLTSCSLWSNNQAQETTSEISQEEKMMENHSGEWSEEEMKKMEAEETMEQKDDMMEKDEMKKDEAMAKTSSVENTLSGTYSEYSPDKLSATQKNILFFHASWCPSCRWADSNFTSSQIPETINLLKVDYDNSSDLKKKYGVTMQHTFVLVDANGEMIKKWSGSNDISDVEMRVKN